MKSQKDIFLEGEGDAWYRRNSEKLAIGDPVSEVIAEMGIKPTFVLEVGCSNGWRLSKLRTEYGCQVLGVDPSLRAVMDAAILRVPAYQMTASTLPVVAGGFDLIIYGFCLYLTDPKDWLQIAAEGDRCLRDGGHIIIHDFADAHMPYARQYEHLDGVKAYHMDFASLWLAHPLYTQVRRAFTDGRGDEGVVVLKKLPASSIPVLP